MKKIKGFLLNNFIPLFVVYYFTLFLDTTSLIVDYPHLETISKIIRYIIYIPLAIRLFLLIPEYKELLFGTKWKEKTKLTKFIYIICTIMFIGLIISAITTSNRRNLFIIFVLLSAYKTDYKKIIKTTFILQVALTGLTVLLSVLNITQDYIVARGAIKRHSLGFLYTTNLVQMYTFSSILYIYSVGTKITYRELFAMQLTNCLLYSLTNTRAEFIMLEIIILATIIIKIAQNKNKEVIIQKIKNIYSKIFTYTFPVYPILSFVMVMCYKFGGIWNNLNKLLSNRLKQTYYTIMQHGITPFGSKIEFLGLGLKEKEKYGEFTSNFVDNEYMQLMLSEGLVFIICFIVILSILLLMLYKKGKYKEVILCSIYLLFGLINPRIVNLLYCPILFMIIPTFAEYKEIKQKSDEEVNNPKLYI